MAPLLEPVLNRIDALTRNARNTWLVMLGALIFVTITLMGVRDIDFYGVGRATQLPLVNVEVPTRLFFAGAPVLIAAIYGYFHLYLLRLWDALAAWQPKVGGHTPLGDAVTPWLVTDMALKLRAGGATSPRAMDGPAFLLNALLAWGFGLFVLGWLWWESATARTPWLTTLASVALIAGAVAGYASARALWLVLRRGAEGREATRELRFLVPLWLLAPLVLIAGHSRTVEPSDWIALAPVELAGENIVERPADWRPHAYAKAEFRAAFRDREGIAAGADLGDLEEAFEAEWESFRSDQIAGLAQPAIVPWTESGFRTALFKLNSENQFSEDVPDLIQYIHGVAAQWSNSVASLSQRGPNLTGADLRGTFLPGAVLAGARMQDARLINADLEGAILMGAILRNADLQDADLQNSDLEAAQLQRANFFRASLSGAHLKHAQLHETWMRAAQLQNANFFEAILIGTEFTGSDMRGASFEEAVMLHANLLGTHLDNSDFRKSLLDYADLSFARLRKADFSRASLRMAKLDYALIEQTDFGGPYPGFSSSVRHPETADLASAKFHGAALRNTDLRGIGLDTGADLRNAFLDGSVILPEGLANNENNPCQWTGIVLSDKDFFARWRWWVEDDFFRWRMIAPPEWHDVEPWDGPEDCRWKTGPMPAAAESKP